jgi:GH25 family lysozyme M1 (1,4-beta-N-acetylmuramidase)
MSAGHLDELEDRAFEARESEAVSEAESPFILRASPAQEVSQPAEAMEQMLPGEAYQQEVEGHASHGHYADGEIGEAQSLAEWHSETFPGAAEFAGAKTSEYAPAPERGKAPAAAAELDPYLAIRPALSPEHAHLSSDEIAMIFGRKPAIIALHALLGSREIRDAALAALFGRAARRTVRVNTVDVPLATYLRGLARLAWEAAEYSLAETGKTAAEVEAEFETPRALQRVPNLVRWPQSAQLLAPTAPGAAVRQDGIDVYSGNNLPAMNDIKDARIRFIIHKSSERTRDGRLIDDGAFKARWRATGAAGLIRGSFHYYRHVEGAAGSAAADRVVAQVGRLLPGDLAPALDLEKDAVSNRSSDPNARSWATELGDFLDTLEIKLGRTPLVYTSVSAWTSHITGKGDYRAADFARFSDYPLWVKEYRGPRFVTLDNLDDPPPPTGKRAKITVDLDTPPHPLTRTFRRAAADRADAHYQRRQTLRPNLPRPWNDWTILQYSPFTPGALLRNRPFSEAFIDFNVSHGGLYSLRGLADLGRTAPHVVGNLSCIAYTEADGRIFLLEFVSGSWRSIEVFANAHGAPAADGDPAAVGVGNEQIIVYRGADAHVYALSRKLTDPSALWSQTEVGGNAVGDPFVMVLGNDLHVVYWDSSDHQAHVVRRAGAWHAGELAGMPAAPSASGAAVAYEYSNGLHIVARARATGHLIDMFRRGGVAVNDDLTATARDDQNNVPPAATYRPATYTRRGGAVSIVFRALHGPIWLIERDTLRARNLGALAVKEKGSGVGLPGAPNAAGSPTALATDTSRVFYRTADGTVIEVFDDSGTAKWREVCAGAAADPTAYADREGVKVTFRAKDGSIRLARLANDVWICDFATMAT